MNFCQLSYAKDYKKIIQKALNKIEKVDIIIRIIRMGVVCNDKKE